MQTVLITGASGFLGGRAARSLAGACRVLAPSHTEFDLATPHTLAAYLEQHQPEIIFHAAALSDVGYCEAHPEESLAVNLLGPEALAKAAQSFGAKLVVCSSDQVYTGIIDMAPLPETMALAPTNVYGRHKLEMEQRVLAACPGAVALRLTWMYDLPARGLKTNLGLPGKLWAAAKAGTPAAFNESEHRAVTWAGTMERALPSIFALPGGVYNAGAENALNTYETALALAIRLGLSPSLIVKAQGQSPRNLAMSCAKLRGCGIDLGDTLASLEECLRAYQL